LSAIKLIRCSLEPLPNRPQIKLIERGSEVRSAK